jgi:nitrilase
MGAEIFLVPSAFTYTTGNAHWEILLRARAIENQAYVIAAAQVGDHPGGRRTFGHSMIIDPWGQVLSEADEDDDMALAEIDIIKVYEVRKKMPCLTQRRLKITTM